MPHASFLYPSGATWEDIGSGHSRGRRAIDTLPAIKQGAWHETAVQRSVIGYTDIIPADRIEGTHLVGAGK
jgi:hypothetical protein